MPETKGRPVKYNAKFHPLLAEVMAEAGKTDDEMVAVLGIARSTFYKWKHDFPIFSDALKKGKKNPDEQVKDSLLTRALGSVVWEEKLYFEDGEPKKEKVYKLLPPDPTSMIFWLKNRLPKEFRDKHVVENDDSEAYEKAVKNLARALGED